MPLGELRLESNLAEPLMQRSPRLKERTEFGWQPRGQTSQRPPLGQEPLQNPGLQEERFEHRCFRAWMLPCLLAASLLVWALAQQGEPPWPRKLVLVLGRLTVRLIMPRLCLRRPRLPGTGEPSCLARSIRPLSRQRELNLRVLPMKAMGGAGAIQRVSWLEC